VLSGSCSTATNAQVEAWRGAGRPAFIVDPRALARGEPVVDRAVTWAQQQLDREPVLIYATANVDELKAVQAELGAEHAGALVEAGLAMIARRLIDCGVRRIVVAGGETSGAVVQALRVQALRIGASICPGVPWTQAEGRPLWLALKSGNFGGPNFFDDALKLSVDGG
jgi:3-dehydrotetronate 4-kinase